MNIFLAKFYRKVAHIFLLFMKLDNSMDKLYIVFSRKIFNFFSKCGDYFLALSKKYLDKAAEHFKEMGSINMK